MEKGMVWKALSKTGKDILDNDEVSIGIVILFIFLFVTIPGVAFILLPISGYMLVNVIFKDEYDDVPLYITNFILGTAIINSIFSFYYFFNIPIFGHYITAFDINNYNYIPYIIVSVFSFIITLIVVSIINSIIYVVKLFFENLNNLKTTDH